MKYIVHDWDDDKGVRIPQNRRKAMAEDGRVLVIDHVSPRATVSTISATRRWVNSVLFILHPCLIRGADHSRNYGRSPGMDDCAQSRETTQTQIGACGFMELNDGNAPLQSTALLLDAVPGVDPDTVTLSPDVGIGKLVDPLPITIVV
jgi:hypothetical protein